MKTLLRNFPNWAIKNGLSSSSASSYCTYLRNLNAISPFAKFGHYLQIIADFLNDKNRNDGDSLYALSICDRMLQEIEIELVSSAPRLSKKDLENGRSALRLLLEFLRYRIILCSSGSVLDNVRKMLSKSNLHKIDGMDSLIAHFGVNNFVRIAIESSYFFDIDIKMDRNKVLIGLFNNGDAIPARATTKGEINPDYSHVFQNNGWWYCENGTPLFPIDIDPDGNKFVRQLINSYTGYTIGQGKGSIFQNYIISHIWGRAFDPRFFTSFWNIVLIPAWANSLMDKDAPQGSVASKLKATFMAICWQYYQLASCSHWGALQMGSHVPQVVNPQDVVHGEYTINVIQRKPANMHPSIVAPIIQVSVTV